MRRGSMLAVANELRAARGPAAVVQELFKAASREGKDCIIESVRTPGEVSTIATCLAPPLRAQADCHLAPGPQRLASVLFPR